MKDKKNIKDTSLSFVTQKRNTEASTSTITQLFTFKKIYSDIQKRTFEELGYEHVETPAYNISDVFGIDIDTGDGIKRTNCNW